MIQLNINYILLRINNTTDRMAYTFLTSYAEVSPNCRLLHTNNYSADATKLVDSPSRSSRNSGIGGLKFEELELGINYDTIRLLVVSSVTSSATLTAMRLHSSFAKSTLVPTRPSGASRRSRDLPCIDEDVSGELELEKVAPKWTTPEWFDVTMEVEAYFSDVGLHGTPGMLDAMMDDDSNIKITTTDLTIHTRSKPFGEGAVRVAAYARTAASTNRLVVKRHKGTRRPGKLLAHLIEEMKIQALCKALALEFNALSEAHHSIDFITSACIVPKGKDTSNCVSLEPFIEGKYVKYNGNAGHVNQDMPLDPLNQAAQAFSHFTFERSNGRFLVSDLQGVGDVLTDPAIHTRDRRRFLFSQTNLGVDGFKHFFRTHQCNDICRRLALKSDGWMVVKDQFSGLRTSWPPMTSMHRANMRVCCSNKLCSRIVLLSSAYKSNKFPEYHWCETCWPQLSRSETSLMCIASGTEPHQFTVSRFFYESQGTIVPRMCEEHRN